MNDLTKCGNDMCELKDRCLRYNSETNSIYQSWLASPEDICQSKDYLFYIDSKNNN